MARRYWLLKSEPDLFSFDDLKAEPGRTAHWDGVRNYQARNLLRDEVKKGDGVLFYHSRISPPAVVGTATVVRDGYPDHTQFDPGAKYFDEKASAEKPRWYMVDIKYGKPLKVAVELPTMREAPGLEEMVLLRKGSRLSVQPVTASEWETILHLGGL